MNLPIYQDNGSLPISIINDLPDWMNLFPGREPLRGSRSRAEIPRFLRNCVSRLVALGAGAGPRMCDIEEEDGVWMEVTEVADKIQTARMETV